MRIRTILLGGLLLALACQQAPRDEATVEFKQADPPETSAPLNAERPGAGSGQALADSTAIVSSNAARVRTTDTTHRFIRTADLRFRVKDVVQATLGIEDIVGAHNGWVERTELRNMPAGQQRIPVSTDSTLEIARYDLVNTVTLRVPDIELDSTLRAIGRWVDLFDHRTVQADDVRLRLMAQAMEARRQQVHGRRLEQAIGDQGRKLRETTAAEEALLHSAERADEARLASLDLEDRIAYSTVKLDIHQPTLVRRELVANDRDIEGYRPPLAGRMGAALGQGWRLLEGLLLALLSVWPVLVLAAAAVVLWRRRPRPAKA